MLLCFLTVLSSSSADERRPSVRRRHHRHDKEEKGRDETVVIPGDRIVNGTVVEDPERFPYAAGLYVRGQTTELACGGVLIAPDIVLTAAHCSGVYEYVEVNRFNIRADFTVGYERFVIDSIVDHPRSVKKDPLSPWRYDVALVKLYGYSATASPVAVNGIATELRLQVGQPLTVFGWGYLSSPYPKGNGAQRAVELQQVELNHVGNGNCQKAKGVILENDELLNYTLSGRIFDEMMCAAAPYKDACKGDSGGPLLFNGGSPLSDVVVGVVSFGIGCATNVFPGVYARISAMKDWIQETVCDLTDYEAPSEFACGDNGQSFAKKKKKKHKKKSPLPPIFPAETTSIVSEEGVDITLAIQLDSWKYETGWLLQSVTSGIVYRYAPIFTYKDVSSESILYETIRGLPADEDYVLTVLDAGGDGLGYSVNDEGYVSIYQGVVNDNNRKDSTPLVKRAAKGIWTEFNFETGERPRRFTNEVYFSLKSPKDCAQGNDDDDDDEDDDDDNDDNDDDDDDDRQSTFRYYQWSGNKQTCEFLATLPPRQADYHCHVIPRAASRCRATCDNCLEGKKKCRDRKQGVFPHHVIAAEQTCKWLQNRRESKQKSICAQLARFFSPHAKSAAEACPVTCRGLLKCRL